MPVFWVYTLAGTHGKQGVNYLSRIYDKKLASPTNT